MAGRLSCRSGGDLGLLALELGEGGDSPVAQDGKLGHLAASLSGDGMTGLARSCRSADRQAVGYAGTDTGHADPGSG
jgi:hypothetical protein